MLSIEYKRLDEINIINNNPKKHNLGVIEDSIYEHGFRVPLVYDHTVNAVLSGNGRAECLNRMMLNKKRVPDGIKIDYDGMWLIPVVVGIDSADREAAEAFLIDDNNSVLIGGDFTGVDTLKLWGDGYLQLLSGAINSVKSVTLEELDLIEKIREVNEQDIFQEPHKEDTRKKSLVIKFVFSDQEDYDTVNEFFSLSNGMSRESALLSLIEEN